MEDGDARGAGRVGGDLEVRAGAVGGEAVLGAGGLQDRAQVDRGVVFLADDEGARVELAVVVGEVGLGRVDDQVVMREAECRERVVGVVVDQVGAAAASLDPAGHLDRLHQGHLGVQDRRVLDADRLRVEERADRPADVVVGARVVGVVVLLVEEHVGAP